jgi:hypothetical protein
MHEKGLKVDVTVIGRDIAIFQITTLLKESVFYCGGY